MSSVAAVASSLSMLRHCPFFPEPFDLIPQRLFDRSELQPQFSPRFFRTFRAELWSKGIYLRMGRALAAASNDIVLPSYDEFFFCEIDS